MRRLLPDPLLSGLLWVVWLALNNTVHPAHLALGALVAVILPLATRRFLPPLPRLRNPATLIRLLLVVLGDIVLANLEVARRILGPEAALRPAFVEVPLDLRDPLGVATLAGIVTLTPGTLSVDLVPGGDRLLVHALHVEDSGRLIATIKQRYESPLREIFP